MFNTYKIDNSYRGPSKIDVTEKRAPTDESVRLLNEMQQKAFDNVLSCVQLDNNELKDITWWIYYDPYIFSEKARVRFMLNGRLFDKEITLPCKYTKSEEIPKLIMNKVLEYIAIEVTVKLFEDNTNIRQFKEIYKR
jgi:hypothetical protein